MHKLLLLRDHLLRAVHGLSAAPDRLAVAIVAGAINWRAGNSLTHEYRAPVRITILDYSGDLDAITTPLCAWLAHYQPDITPGAIRWEAELRDPQTWDLEITVPLSERIIVRHECDTGRLYTEHGLGEYQRDPCAPPAWDLYTRSRPDADYTLTATWPATTEAPAGE